MATYQSPWDALTGSVDPNPNTRLYLDWNQPVNWYDDASSFATVMTTSGTVSQSSAQQIFGQDTALFGGGRIYTEVGNNKNHLGPGINDNWYVYVWCYPTSFPGAAYTLISQGGRGDSVNWRLVGWSGFSPADQIVWEAIGGNVGGVGTYGTAQVARLNEWNLYLIQYDATTRMNSLHHDNGAGTMVLCAALGPWPAGGLIPRPNFVNQVYPVQIGDQGGYPFFGHIGPVKMAMGGGMKLWPMENFPTPAVANASP